MEDSQIIALYWQRDESAIDHTQRKYGSYCQSIAQRILDSPADAEESVNDTWLHAWNAMPPQRPTRLSTFLGRITRNIAIDRRRKNTAKKRSAGTYDLALEELSYCLDGGGDPEAYMLRTELTDCINDFLGTLPQGERRVFIRRYWHFCSISEIAGQYGYSLTKTKTMLHRTRKKLKQYLMERGVMDAG